MLPSGTSSSKSCREDLPEKGNEIFKIFRTRRGQICAHRSRPSSPQPLRSLFPDYTPQRLGSGRAFLSWVSAAEKRATFGISGRVNGGHNLASQPADFLKFLAGVG